MTRTLVFKFRDDLLLSEKNVPFIRFDAAYTRFSAQYADELRRDRQLQSDANRAEEGQTENLERFRSAFDTISKQGGHIPTPLFSGEHAELPLKLLEQALAIRQEKAFRNGPPPIPVQNPYNVFRLPLPDTMTPEAIAALLKTLRPFLPPNTQRPKSDSEVGTASSLLTHLYLTDDPIPTAYNWPEEATAYADQQYFDDMHIDRSHTGQGVGLTVLEAHGWDTTHPQFAGRTGQLSLLNTNTFDLDPTQFSLTQPGDYADYAKHGNKILGVLWAGMGNHNPPPAGTDLCRGVVPAATVRLVSCLSSLILSRRSRSTFAHKTYNEATALALALTNSAPGDVVLVEVGYGRGRYPLSLAPAIDLLTRLAESAGITVVYAAGNGGVLLTPATTTDFRNEILNLLPIDSQDFYSEELWQQYEATGGAGGPYATPADFVAAMQQTPPPGLLVGAVARTAPGDPVQRLPTSTYGDGVAVYAQGEGILTTTVRGQYDTLGSTSGAAAIIAGMATALQGEAKKLGRLLSAADLKQLFRQGRAVSPSGFVPNYADAYQAMLSMP